MRNFVTTIFVLLLTSFSLFAQSADNVEMADVLRSSGKIYVVVAVIGVILIGLILYLFNIDRRLKKIENHD